MDGLVFCESKITRVKTRLRLIQFNSISIPNINNRFSNFSISGNAISPEGICERVLFINSKYEMEAAIVPNSNGDFIYYCNDDTYTVILIGPGNIETKVLYNVKALNTNINIH